VLALWLHLTQPELPAELDEFITFAGGYLYGFADTHLLRLKLPQ